MSNNGGAPLLLNDGAPDEALDSGTKGFLLAQKTPKSVRGVESAPSNGEIGGCALTKVSNGVLANR